MWNFIKQNPKTFIFAGLILVGAIIGVIVGVATKGGWKDNGLMDRGDGGLHWSIDDLPITLKYSPDDLPEFHLFAFRKAVEDIEAEIGADVFVLLEDATSHVVDDPAALPRGFAVVKTTNTLDVTQGGVTDLRWDKLTAELIGAVVQVREDLAIQLLAPTYKHELLHVLGLEHDEGKNSIMYPDVQPAHQEITDKDLELLRKLYVGEKTATNATIHNTVIPIKAAVHVHVH